MIILGIILLVAGFLLNISLLWVVGLILLIVGLVLMVMGRMGRAVGGRRHYYSPAHATRRQYDSTT
jgi:hypothetical protein